MTSGSREPRLAPLVLVVEDDADCRFLFAELLSSFGYTTAEACDGAEAVRATRDLEPDIVVMDLSLPVVDGIEATRILKADPSTEAVPVLALTGHAAGDSRDRAEDAGFDAFLVKPCRPEDLRRCIESLRTRGATRAT